MSEFVNYRKRSVGLPPGCKDLIDVLRHRDQQSLQAITERARRATMTRHESLTGTLSDVGKYVAMLFESSGLMVTLTITATDERLSLHVAKVDGTRIWSYACVEQDSGQESVMRDFFARRSLELPVDSGIPATFFPSLPVHLTYQISPMPSQCSIFSELITALFREVCGSNEDTELSFDYEEISESG